MGIWKLEGTGIWLAVPELPLMRNSEVAGTMKTMIGGDSRNCKQYDCKKRVDRQYTTRIESNNTFSFFFIWFKSGKPYLY